MARTKKAVNKTVEKKNPAIFTDEETVSFRKTLIQELTWQSKGTISESKIVELVESVINRDEKTTLWLRRNGCLRMTRLLIQRFNEGVDLAC